MKLIKSINRNESFESIYFDYQKSYKYLLRLNDKENIETSLYVHFINRRVVDIAIDISTMIGCPVGCKFCASAEKKFVRYLTVKEMVFQFETIKNTVASFQGVNKIIAAFQGIGEPSMIAKDVIEASLIIKKMIAET